MSSAIRAKTTLFLLILRPDSWTDSPLQYPGIDLPREAEACDPPVIGVHPSRPPSFTALIWNDAKLLFLVGLHDVKFHPDLGGEQSHILQTIIHTASSRLNRLNSKQYFDMITHHSYLRHRKTFTDTVQDTPSFTLQLPVLYRTGTRFELPNAMVGLVRSVHLSVKNQKN